MVPFPYPLSPFYGISAPLSRLHPISSAVLRMPTGLDTLELHLFAYFFHLFLGCSSPGSLLLLVLCPSSPSSAAEKYQGESPVTQAQSPLYLPLLQGGSAHSSEPSLLAHLPIQGPPLKNSTALQTRPVAVDDETINRATHIPDPGATHTRAD